MKNYNNHMKNTIQIVAVGDIMPGGVLSGKNDDFLDEQIIEIFNSADIRVGTLETAIGNEPNWFDGKMQRLGDVIYAKDIDVIKLKTLNIDVVSLANNHVFDLGPEGIRHTIDVLDELGIKHCGAGMNIEEASKPVVIEKDNKTIAFVAYCDWRPETTGWCLMANKDSAGVNPLYDSHVEEQIKDLKLKYDYVVVIPHWGKEHTYWPTNNVYKMADKMIKWGADVVLGGHTHRIQPVVYRKGKTVAYSMGNFLFIDRIIVHPRSTWYPGENEDFDIDNIPRAYGYPYVEEPTLKCSPEKNRIGLIVKVELGGSAPVHKTWCTQMDDKCHISLYAQKNPTRSVKRLIDLKIYPIVYGSKRFLGKACSVTKKLFSNIIHLCFLNTVCKWLANVKPFRTPLFKMLSYRNPSVYINFSEFSTLFKETSLAVFEQLDKRDLKRVYSDWVKCKMIDGIDAIDYLAYDWVNRSQLSRANYITDRINSKMYHKYDESSLCPIMADKARFNLVYKDYIKRDWLFVCKTTKYHDFVKFCKKHKKIVTKPKDGQRGFGVQLVDVSSEDKIEKAWIECRDNCFVVEEVIKQGELSKLHKESVNTVRISTAIDDNGVPHIVASIIRCGRGDNIVDNAYAGGILCGIDVNTGIIISEGVDKTSTRYMYHPDTGIQFLGMQIPKWNELKDIALKAAGVIPGLRYIGWDWVLCEDNHWELLEGNEPGSPNVLQLGKGCGLLNEYNKYLK